MTANLYVGEPSKVGTMQVPTGGASVPYFATPYISMDIIYSLNTKCTTIQPKLYNRCHITWGGHCA